MVETRNIFYRTDDSSLKRTASERQAKCQQWLQPEFRLSEMCPVSTLFVLRSGRLGDIPSFQKCFF